MLQKRIFIALLLLSGIVALRAEVVVLRTGSTVEGTIVFQNEEVVIVKTYQGKRYQYPMNEVKEIRQTSSSANAVIDATSDAEPMGDIPKRVVLAVEVSGGGNYLLRDMYAGGSVSGSLFVGTHNLLGRHIFLGGGLGYLGAFYPDASQEKTQQAKTQQTKSKQTYSFLPLTLVMRVPLMQQKHAPMVGAQIGYGVALSKDYLGGLHAGLNIGYCYRISEQQSLYVAADVLLQQAYLTTNATITDEQYTYNYQQRAGHCLLQYGLRVGISL